jgi:iron complex transport system ATP-binding protein
VDEVLTSGNISTCFDHPIRLTRTDDGRWQVRAQRSVHA